MKLENWRGTWMEGQVLQVLHLSAAEETVTSLFVAASTTARRLQGLSGCHPQLPNS